jgi:hypothetical protein
MQNFFESPFKGKIIKDHIQNPNIVAGKYSIIPDIIMVTLSTTVPVTLFPTEMMLTG